MPSINPMSGVPATQLFSPYAKIKVTVVRRKLRRLIRLVGRDKFTDRQLSVLALWERGCTQQEIASNLGIHQTSIHKCLFGNLNYHGPYIGCRYGGVLAKVKKQIHQMGLDREWEEFKQLSGLG